MQLNLYLYKRLKLINFFSSTNLECFMIKTNIINEELFEEKVS